MMTEANRSDIKVGTIIYEPIFTNPIRYEPYQVIGGNEREFFVEQVEKIQRTGQGWKMRCRLSHCDWWYINKKYWFYFKGA